MRAKRGKGVDSVVIVEGAVDGGGGGPGLVRLLQGGLDVTGGGPRLSEQGVYAREVLQRDDLHTALRSVRLVGDAVPVALDDRV